MIRKNSFISRSKGQTSRLLGTKNCRRKFLNSFECRLLLNQKKIFIILLLKIPSHLNCVAALPCEMSSVLNATIEKKTTSVTTHFKSASSSSKADTLNIWCKNCRMWQLLWTITETINTLFPVVNFFNKCVVTEVVFFSVVAFKTLDISQGSVTTQLRCGGIFIANFLLILTMK